MTCSAGPSDGPDVIAAPRMPNLRLVIRPGAGAVSLERLTEGCWLRWWPEVPRPGRLIVTGPPGRRERHYEVTWRGRRYLPRRHELRRALWQLPGSLPPANTREGDALRNSIAAACERRPVSCAACPGRPRCI